MTMLSHSQTIAILDQSNKYNTFIQPGNYQEGEELDCKYYNNKCLDHLPEDLSYNPTIWGLNMHSTAGCIYINLDYLLRI